MILWYGLGKYTSIKIEYVYKLERLVQSEVLSTTIPHPPSKLKLRWSKTTNEPIAIDNFQVRNEVRRESHAETN
jgi:hypothetical protein